MKKNIIVLIAAVLLVFGQVVMAEQGVSVKVEGENFDYATFKVPLGNSGEFSDGKFINLLNAPTEEEYKIAYTFDVPVEGTYSLYIRCSQMGETYSTDYFFSVNEGDYITSRGNSTKKVADFPNNVYGSTLIKEYSLGKYDLYEGKNTLTILVDKEDIRKGLDGKLCFILDFFRFDLEDGDIKDIVQSQRCGVYEKNQNVKFTITRVVKDVNDHTYNYEIVDFWGRKTDEGSFVIPGGSRKKTVNLGKFGIGWYDMKVYKADTKEQVAYDHFSVVPLLSERYKGDTPFAADSGSAVLLKDDSIAEDFEKTLPLAGVKWVRERADAIDFSANGYKDYNYFTNRFNLIKKNNVKTTQILVSDHLSWGNTTFTDLFRAYNFQKEFIKNTENKIDLLEIDNELDGATSGIPGDRYSAYMKAMYLAKVDSGTDMKMSMVSLCLDPERTFTDNIFRNDLMNWTDIFNFHAHTNPSSNKINGIRKAFLDQYNETKITKYDTDIPNWLTEAGIYMPLKDGAENIDIQQQRDQARYLATATIEGLSEGVDKFFWFIWVKYNENGSDLSTFDTNYNPYPAYQAEAICSYVLGKGKYIGENCDDNAKTYMFDNGKNDVMVLWTDAPKKYKVLTDKKVLVTDIMGQTTELLPQNGYVMVDIAYYPTYVSFDGKADIKNYYPCEYKQTEVKDRSFNEAERIIIQQTFEQDLVTACNKGYLLENNTTENMILTLNNFNKEEKKVKITGELENCDVVIDKETVLIPAMSKIDIPVKITPHMDGKFVGIDDYRGYLIFKAYVNDFESSPSVATVRISNDVKVSPTFEIEGGEDINNFDINNVMEGAVVSSNIVDDGSYQFHVQLNASAGWYYPRIKVTDTSRLKNSDGLVFKVKADEKTVGMGDFKCFINLSDGRRYYTGSDAKFSCLGEWVQAKIPWTELMLFESPLGAFDTRSFDADLVESVEIGCNLYPGSDAERKMSFFLKDMGYFLLENKAEKSEDIIISGIEENKKYDKDKLKNIMVNVSGSCSNIVVMLTDDIFEDYEHGVNSFRLNLSSLSRGKYTLRVKATDKYGKHISNKVDFYID